MKPLVVNFYGGPGSRKSTLAANIFAELKWENINAELISEYAKDKVWEESFKVLENQAYIFGKQYHKIYRVSKHVDVLIVDSPLLLSIVYDKQKSINHKNYVIEKYNEFNNLDYFLVRNSKYNSKGRTQTESQAKELDNSIYNMLKEIGVKFKVLEGSRQSVPLIFEEIMYILNK